MKNTFLRWLFRRPSAPPASADGPREDDDVLSQVRMNWTRASAPSAGFFTEEVSQINEHVSPPATPDNSSEPRWRSFTQDDCTVRLDISTQVIQLNVVDSDGEKTLYPTVLSVMGMTYGAKRKDVKFISAALLLQKAKQFDDGLVAAIALAMQRGLPGFQSKPKFVEALLAQLTQQGTPELDTVIPLLLAAGILGGGIKRAPEQWQRKVDVVLGEFLADPLRSKPLGVYTWTAELTDIFRQDRMLQTAITGKSVEALVSALQPRPDLRASYEKLLMIGERLTNHNAYADLRAPARLENGDEGAVLFPPCNSPETTLMERMFPPPTALPEDFSLIDEVVRRLAAGKLSLMPTSYSGWYEYQLWSLEPLVTPDTTPEAEHLQWYPKYRDHLIRLFKGAYALVRETHVKDLLCSRDTSRMSRIVEQPPIVVTPSLSIEPTATFYKRRALSYRFICRALSELIGRESLEQIFRASEEGPVSQNLANELRQMEALFWGAYLISMDDLGLPASVDIADSSPSAEKDEKACIQQLVDWKQCVPDDPDVGQDSRMMVPVFHDVGRKKTKVWIFVGWESTWITAGFKRAPKVEVLDQSGDPSDRRIEFGSSSYMVATPVMHEVYVSKLMDRTEFRAHCDKYRTTAEIIKHLV